MSSQDVLESVRAQVEAILAEDLYWFGVRHHSPAVARHVEAAIRARRPKVIFLEGPHEANDLIGHLVDRRTRPPVAVYSSYRDDNNVLGLAGVASPAEDIPARFTSWYPLLSYSPEYVTLRTAAEVGAAVVFMDLPHHALIHPTAEVGPASRAGPEEVPLGSRHLRQTEDDRLLAESGFYQALARAAGYRSWPEAWDSLFEVRDFADHDDFRREMAAFCAAARATTAPQRIHSDGTLPRERFMLRTIRETLAARGLGACDAMVVCGGFHLFLNRADTEPPPEPPPGTVYVTVVPYSYFRVSELSGYGAGNRAPRFYETLYELTQAGRAADVAVEHIVAVLEQGRKAGEPLSSADAIAATGHAEMLARLRGRPVPVLDDIHDALITCCCKGDPAQEGRHLLHAMDVAGIGHLVGKVTPALGRLPVVNDFHCQLADLDLGEVMGREKRIHLTLDLRKPIDSRRSAFLHRLVFLDVPLGGLTDAPSGELGTGTIFREKWALGWNPRVEDALIEQVLYGDSVEAAAVGRLRERLAQEAGHAGNTCCRLLDAAGMDLPDLVSRAEQLAGNAIDADDRFVSLCEALGHLTVLERYAAHRGLRRDVIDDLVVRCYDRACFALGGAVAVPDDQQADVVSALLALAEVVQRGGHQELDPVLFREQVRRAAAESPVPFLRGAFLGALAELRAIGPEVLAAEVAGLARAPVEQMVTAGDLVDGILAVSRTSVLLGADALVGAIDELLRAADWDSFLLLLPRLRAAFERLHERDRDSLAQRVAVLHGLAGAEEVTDLRTSVGAAARIARIDQEVDRIMQDWSFT
jgi:hypothetical protein